MTALNLDWTPVSVISKFVDVLVGNFTNQGYDIVLEGIDLKSKTAKEEVKNEILKDMIFKEQLDRPIKEMTEGQVQLMNDDPLPQNNEELETFMSLSYKQDLSLQMEKAVNHILEINDYKDIEKRVIRDLIENKKGAVRVYYDGNNAIKIRYVDIEYLVHTRTSDPQFKDVSYFGEVVFMSIQDIRRMNPEMPEEELFNIAKNNSGKYGNRNWNGNSTYIDTDTMYNDYDDYRVQVLDFYVKSIDFKNFEKKENQYGNFFINEKDDSYKLPKKSKKKRSLIKKEHESSYEGLWVVGTDSLIRYGRTKNMVSPVEDGEHLPILLPQYIVVSPSNRSGRIRSLVSKMIPHSDKMMLAQLNAQNLLANAAPSGLSIDVSAMHDIQIGNKKNLSPLEMIKLYRQTGVILYNGMGEDGQPRNMRPIEALSGGVSDSIVQYLNIYQTELENIRNLTGLAPVDASTPQKNALIGVQKLAIQQSNNATRELQEGFVNILKRVALNTTRMLQDQSKFGGNLTYLQKVIGEYPAKMLGMHDDKDKTLAQYGIFVKAQPTEEERQELNISIQKAVESGSINVSDELTIKNIKSIKEAEAFLKIVIVKNQAAKMKQEQESYQAKAQADAQAAQASVESKITLERAKAEALMALETTKKENELQLSREKFEQQKALKELDNIHKLEQIRASLSMDEEFGRSPAQLKDDSGKKGSLTKVSPAPPTKVTPPTAGFSPSKIRE